MNLRAITRLALCLMVLGSGCTAVVPPAADETNADGDTTHGDLSNGVDADVTQCDFATQEGCASSEFCDDAGVCQAKFGNNHVCTANRECASGICTVGLCAQCTLNSQCGSNEWCSEFGDCLIKWTDGHACDSDAECQSGSCMQGLCG